MQDHWSNILQRKKREQHFFYAVHYLLLHHAATFVLVELCYGISSLQNLYINTCIALLYPYRWCFLSYEICSFLHLVSSTVTEQLKLTPSCFAFFFKQNIWRHYKCSDMKTLWPVCPNYCMDFYSHQSSLDNREGEVGLIRNERHLTESNVLCMQKYALPNI